MMERESLGGLMLVIFVLSSGCLVGMYIMRNTSGTLLACITGGLVVALILSMALAILLMKD